MSSTSNTEHSEVNSKIKKLYEEWTDSLKCIKKNCKCKRCEEYCICAGPFHQHSCPSAIEKFLKATWICEYYFKHQDDPKSLSKFVDEIIDLGFGYELEDLEGLITDPSVKKKINNIMKIFQYTVFSFEKDPTADALFYIFVEREEEM